MEGLGGVDKSIPPGRALSDAFGTSGTGEVVRRGEFGGLGYGTAVDFDLFGPGGLWLEAISSILSFLGDMTKVGIGTVDC